MSVALKVTILGCGTSTGVPVPACSCAVCSSKDSKNSRLRASILIHTPQGADILVDTSPDLRQQALRVGLRKIDAVLFTHAHADHILGLDDLRGFNFAQGREISCYATTRSWEAIEHIFHYSFKPDPEYKGGGIPKIQKNVFAAFDQLSLGGVNIQTFSLLHGHGEVIGFRVGDFAYATDCNVIPERSMEELRGVKTLILDGLRHEPHPTHFTIGEAIEISRQLQAERTVLTHHTHTIEYHSEQARLPAGVELAYDGMEIIIASR